MHHSTLYNRTAIPKVLGNLGFHIASVLLFQPPVLNMGIPKESLNRYLRVHIDSPDAS